jgi:hypothetical protein
MIKLSGYKLDYFFITPNEEETQEWYESFSGHTVQLNLKVNYAIGSILGKGNFASVYDA